MSMFFVSVLLVPILVTTKKGMYLTFLFNECGRWDLNPHDCNSHKILSLARLPIPTLPHIKLDDAIVDIRNRYAEDGT